VGRVSMLDYPYVEPHLTGARQRPSLIVLQSSMTTSYGGAAFGIAMCHHKNDAKESYHYVVDERSAIRCVDVKMEAQYAPDTRHTIGILICDDPSGPISRWEDSSHALLLNHMAVLVANLCIAHRIPARFLTSEELQRWSKWRIKRRGGIVVNGFMANTYWPEDYFMQLVRNNIKSKRF
jgi:hypothetical protein